MDFNPLQNEVQLLMLLYAIIVVAALFVARIFFSSESRSFLFLFRFFIASVLFAVGYARLNGFIGSSHYHLCYLQCQFQATITVQTASKKTRQ